ncbi:MAG: 3-phosphoshikimate 1-carboxyvinyltransferase [Methanobacterium sp. PtaU1.Bin242]|nr:MAG: 3-phosphoshikimate 1-carboxyvinyltransferase [Methanobacterium sp. PtaU1.Bin242]
MELHVQQAKSIRGVVNAPPSKSYSHRAFIIASLAEGASRLKYPLYSEDTLASLDSCRALGCEIEVKEDECIIQGTSGDLKTPENVVDVKNSGTTLRIMTSVASLAPYYTVLTGDSSLRKRPMHDLLQSLENLGVSAISARNNGKAPIIVKGGFKGGTTAINGDVSSQFISSILIAAPYADEPVHLKVKGNFISRPYVEMTLDIMKDFGVTVDQKPSNSFNKNHEFYVEPQKYKGTEYTVEGDYSSASYLVAAAAALNSNLIVKNLNLDSKQGDRVILDIVKKMGCEVKLKKDEVEIHGHGELQGIEVELENSPDLLPTVAALGAMAKGTTHIKGVEHARYKETDRIHTCALELAKLGVSVMEEKDGLIIQGGALGGVVDSHNDHRLVMALYLIGLKVGKVKIENASVYDVSFPNFTHIMEKLVTGM